MPCHIITRQNVDDVNAQLITTWTQSEFPKDALLWHRTTVKQRRADHSFTPLPVVNEATFTVSNRKDRAPFSHFTSRHDQAGKEPSAQTVY